MPGIKCKCEYEISLTASPNKNRGILMGDVAAESHGLKLVTDIIGSHLYRDVVECPECGRLMVESKKNQGSYISFRPEDEEYHRVLE